MKHIALLALLHLVSTNQPQILVVPRIGELGSPQDAFSPAMYPAPEHLFTTPWAVLGRDWVLRPGLASAWSELPDGHWLVVVPSAGLARFVWPDTGCSQAVSRRGTHLLLLEQELGWRDLLAAPCLVNRDGTASGLGGFEIRHWIPQQHVLLARQTPGVGPEGIMIVVCRSRADAFERLLSGEIDALDDLSEEERRHIHLRSPDLQVFARRVNTLIYVMWNTEYPSLESPETRRWLGTLVDKRRLASRIGSRPSWITDCPVPPDVPGAWAPWLQAPHVSSVRADLPESLVIVVQDQWEAIRAGEELQRDIEDLGIRVYLESAQIHMVEGRNHGQVAAYVGAWSVSLEQILPPSPLGMSDPLQQSRARAAVDVALTEEHWRMLTGELRVLLEEEAGLLCLCWLGKWAAVSPGWLNVDPGPGPLTADVATWEYRSVRIAE